MNNIIIATRQTENVKEDKRQMCGMGVGRSGHVVWTKRNNNTLLKGLFPSNIYNIQQYE